jgi:tripartite-type tricarboxylate transporter receptor subunit TctC
MSIFTNGHRRKAMLLAAATFAMFGLAWISVSPACAQWSPTKPVRLILGFPPGGATDLVARAIQPRMSAALGQQIVIDNRPGANGIIAGELTARGEPDGHTVLFAHIGLLVISPAMQKVPYDPLRDFAPIGQAVALQNLIIAHPSYPVKTLKDLIALAKAKPGQINYATAGVGSPGHLAGVLFETMTGTRLSHIPYKGGGPAIVDLLAGHVPVFFSVISTGVPHVQSGKARGLAVTGTKRAEAIPDIPTVAESGVPGYAATNWYGLVAPAKTPKTIIDRIHREMSAALLAPEVADSLKSRGIDVAPSTPAEFGAFIRKETDKWVPIIKKSGMKDAS